MMKGVHAKSLCPGAYANIIKPMIRYVCRMPDGSMLIRMKEWNQPATTEAIAAWMESYAARVEAGYKPDGFEVAPLPFFARVMLRNKSLADWRRS